MIFTWCAIWSTVCVADTVVRESFRSRRGGDVLTLPVQIAGNNCTFLLDTGSPVTVVDARLRPFLKKTNHEKRVSDGYRSMNQQTYALPRGAKIGRSISMESIPFVLCYDFGAMRDVIGIDFDGIIGCDCLKDKQLEIDFDQGLVRFFERIDNTDHELGRVVRLQTNKYGHPTIPIALGPGPATPFVIDTGAVGIHMQLEKSRYQLLENLNEIRSEGTSAIRAIHGTTIEHAGIVNSARLGKFRLRQLKVETGPYDFVGLDFLSRFAVTLDFPAGKAFLRPSRKFLKGPDRNLSGAKFRRINDVFQVRDVEADSFAAAAGLHVGDVITQVNGVDTSEMSLFEMRRRLARENSRITMRTERAGEVRTLTLMISRSPVQKSK